jgi:hypothetical protein
MAAGLAFYGVASGLRDKTVERGKGEGRKGRRVGLTGGTRMAAPHARGELAGGSAARWWAAHGLKGDAG